VIWRLIALWPWLAVTRGGFSHARQAHGPLPVSHREILRRRDFWGTALGHFAKQLVWAVVAMFAWGIIIRRVAAVQWPEELANRIFADAPAA